MQCKVKNTVNIKKEIAILGFNQADFSDYIGISKPFMSQILNKKRCCSPKIANKIARSLGGGIENIFLITVSDNQTKRR